MRAMVCHHLSDDRSGLRFQPDWPDQPPPGPGEVTVGIVHAALNYPDVLMLAGGYQFAPPLPFIPGVEAAGTVVDVGTGVDTAWQGQRVVVGARFGCFAERLTVPLTAVRPVPAGLDLADAAIFTVAALTAFVALVRRGRVKAGERVAVAGAGGGTGLAAVAVAKAFGATVVALASTAAKLDAARRAGADELVLARRDGTCSGFGPVDVVFDPVGGALTGQLLAHLRRGGRYLVIGFVGGIGAVAWDRIASAEIDLIGVRAGEYARRDPAGGARNLAAIDALAAAGLRVPVGLRVALPDAADAFAAMAAGTLIGKAVIDCGG